MSYYFVALTMYWGWSFYDRPTWWRLAMAIALGLATILSCALDVHRQRQREWMRWDD